MLDTIDSLYQKYNVLLFIDGTKIEANANRYTFVWRGTLNYHLAGLLDTIDSLYQKYNVLIDENEYSIKYDIPHAHMFVIEGIEKVKDVIEKNRKRKLAKHKKLSNNTIIEIDNCSPLEIVKLQKNLLQIVEQEQIEFVYGKGKKKPEIQQLYEELEACGERLMGYKECFEIMGRDRNSYSKTDLEATFMRMKEDHMCNGQLKAGYNLQIATENQFVLHYDIFPNPTDTKTLLPFLGTYPHELKLVVADAGYGSEENLLTLDELEIDHLIKYGIFDKEQKRKYKESSRNLANWYYDEEEDSYTHPDGWKYIFHHLKHRKTETGFEQEVKVYHAEVPDLAPQKGLYVNERYQQLKEREARALLSPEGSQIFAQRKVDVEPVFGQIKACLGYKRCNLRGKQRVEIDMGLVLMANNLLKYNKRTRQY